MAPKLPITHFRCSTARVDICFVGSPGRVRVSATYPAGEATPNVGLYKYFEIGWEISEVIWLAAELLKERWLAGTFSSIEEAT